MKLTEAIAELFVSGVPAEEGAAVNEFRFSKAGGTITMWVWNGSFWESYSLNSDGGGS